MNSTDNLTDSQLDKVMNTLINLKALHTGAGTPGEAAAALEAINKLAFKYNLSIEEIPEKGQAKVDKGYKKNKITMNIKHGDPTGTWQYDLLNHMCHLNFCRLIMYRNTKMVEIIGQAHNIEIVKGQYEFVLAQMKRIVTAGWRAKYPTTYGQLACTPTEFSFKRSFRMGAIATIVARLTQMRLDNIAAAGTAGSSLVVQKDRELDDAVNEMYKDLKTSKSSNPKINPHDYQAGRAAGHNVNLNRPLTENGASRGKLS